MTWFGLEILGFSRLGHPEGTNGSVTTPNANFEPETVIFDFLWCTEPSFPLQTAPRENLLFQITANKFILNLAKFIIYFSNKFITLINLFSLVKTPDFNLYPRFSLKWYVYCTFSVR